MTSSQPQTVTREDWIAARTELLAKEKAATRAREALTAARQAMPWLVVEKDYRFDSRDGRKGLAELFGSQSQLIVCHFMFGPEAVSGCPACSFWADGYDRHVAHLAQRDVAFVAASRAPLQKINAYAERMGWSFPWVSTIGDEFNRDFGVLFTHEELQSGARIYNYAQQVFPLPDAPGFSVFVRKMDKVFHTYSCFGRGLENLNAAYHFLDLVPKGRDETGLPVPMAWLRRRDEYKL